MIYNTVTLANGESVYYREQGSGQVLIFLHGNMTSSYHLEHFMQSLPAGIRVIAPDMRGFGQSSYHQPISSLTELSDDLSLFVNSLNIDTYSVAGWSTGGGVALQHSIDYPEQVNHLILVSSIGVTGYPLLQTFPTGEQSDQYLSSKAEIKQDPMLLPIFTAFQQQDRAFIRQLWDYAIYTFKKPAADDYELLIDDILSQVNLADIYYALSHFNLTTEHNGVQQGADSLAGVKAPVLLLHGAEDKVIPLTVAEQSHQALSEVNSAVQLQVYPQSGHSLFIDEPMQLAEQIVNFIK
jgi:pimeloyl-ACP methyl ester carboxylesterase